MTNKTSKTILILLLVILAMGFFALAFKNNPNLGDDLPYGLSDPVDGFVPEEELGLQGVTWQWKSFTTPKDSYEIQEPERYTVTFNEDLSVNIKADCNLGNGTYTFDSNGAVLLDPMIAMTRAFCPEDSRDSEFIQNLTNARIYFMKDNNLYLDLMADGGTMMFVHNPNQAVENASYLIDGKQVTLKDGVAEESLPGSATKTVTKLVDVSQELAGDDAVVILTQDPGGSGLFYYVAVCEKLGSGCQGTNAMLLGDRVAMKSFSMRNDMVQVEYLTRGNGVPMTAQPTKRVMRTFKLKNVQLSEMK